MTPKNAAVRVDESEHPRGHRPRWVPVVIGAVAIAGVSLVPILGLGSSKKAPLRSPSSAAYKDGYSAGVNFGTQGFPFCVADDKPSNDNLQQWSAGCQAGLRDGRDGSASSPVRLGGATYAAPSNCQHNVTMYPNADASVTPSSVADCLIAYWIAGQTNDAVLFLNDRSQQAVLLSLPPSTDPSIWSDCKVEGTNTSGPPPTYFTGGDSSVVCTYVISDALTVAVTVGNVHPNTWKVVGVQREVSYPSATTLPVTPTTGGSSDLMTLSQCLAQSQASQTQQSGTSGVSPEQAAMCTVDAFIDNNPSHYQTWATDSEAVAALQSVNQHIPLAGATVASFSCNPAAGNTDGATDPDTADNGGLKCQANVTAGSTAIVLDLWSDSTPAYGGFVYTTDYNQ